MTKYLKGECVHCGGHIEFPAESAGLTADCPHCGKQTDLLLAAPKDTSRIPSRIIVWTAAAVILSIAGLGAAIYAVKRAEKWANAKKKAAEAVQVQKAPPAPMQPAPEDPISKAQFHVSDVKLEKAPGTSLVHAVGTLENLAPKARYGVKIEFELFDAGGKKIGTTSDYQNAIDPGSKWTFQAPVMSGKAVAAKAVEVTEQQ